MSLAGQGRARVKTRKRTSREHKYVLQVLVYSNLDADGELPSDSLLCCPDKVRDELRLAEEIGRAHV